MLFIFASFLPYEGMAMFPFIVLRQRKHLDDKTLLNHERIHLAQQRELLVVPFYFLYLFLYVVNLIRFRNHHKAYRMIIFEREAYHFDKNESYLITRKPYAWLRKYSD